MNQDINELTQAIPGVVYQFVVTATGDWQFYYVSQGIVELYECSAEAVCADHDVITSCILPEDRESFHASVLLATAQLIPWQHEYRVCTRSGQIKWIKGHALPQKQANGDVLWHGILVDITDCKNIEANLVRLQKIYAAIIQANKLIARSDNLSELLSGICKIIVEFGGMKMAWIGTADDTGQRIVPIACYGIGVDYLSDIFISTNENMPEGRGPTGIAFRENRIVIEQDFQQSSLTQLWHDRAKPYGWEASATFPIQRDNTSYAALSVYSAEKNVFDEVIISLLKGMAEDISYAIATLDTKAKRNQVEQQLKQSEQMYRTLFETVRQGVLYQGADGKIITANPAAEKILGLSVTKMQELTSDSPYWQAIHLDGSAFLGDTHPAMQAIATGQPIQDVIMGVYNPKLQCQVWLNINAMPIFKENTAQVDYAYITFDDITERLQWQSALQESEQRFRNFANAAPVLMWVADTDKECTWFNDTWLAYTGRTMEQEIGVGWADNVHIDDLAGSLEIYYRCFDLRQPFSMEYRLRGKDGQYRWFIDVGKPRYDEHGQFCGYIGMLTDIDDRKKLEESADFRQFSLNHIAEEVFWINQNAQILDANQSACDTLGYTLEEIKQLKVFDIDPIFPAEQWQQHWQELKQQKTLRFESAHKNRSGVIFPIEIVANFFEYDGVGYNCALARNISERKTFEKALKEKTDYLNTILNSEPECVKVVDKQGNLLDMNQAGLKLLEVDTLEEVQQYGLMNFVLPEFRALFKKLHHDVFQGQNRTLEFIIKSKYGKQHWVDTHAAPLYDDYGHVKALVAVTRDITDRVNLLRELEIQARIDCLTGLPNRRYFLELAEQELARFQRYHNPLSVLMMDIDYFKHINDSYGHKAGDLVLQKLADVCRGILREIDIVGRMGGEEFAILLPETSGIKAIEVAERLRDALENTLVVFEQQLTAYIHFTVSIGVITVIQHDTTVDKMLIDADAALYEAKNTGRNQVIAYIETQ